MAGTRDYKAEYRRRIERAAARGLSRSQARGHARPNEAPLRKGSASPGDARLEAALKELRRNGQLTAAAKSQNMAPERLRRFLYNNAFAERRGRTWHITDRRPREMTVLSEGEARQLILRDADQASLNGRHLSAVGQFLRTNDVELLRPFEGQSVMDAKDRAHPLETDPNALHRIAAAGSEVFHNIYRLIL